MLARGDRATLPPKAGRFAAAQGGLAPTAELPDQRLDEPRLVAPVLNDCFA